MQYIQLHFKAPNTAKKSALLHLWLAEQPCINGWEEGEKGDWIAYVADSDFTPAFQSDIQEAMDEIGIRWSQSSIAEQNWNQVWEESYQPVVVEGFCRVRASFHAADTRFPYELEITPKMAFGTGHHATTFMMLSQMQHADWKGKQVLDYGCGTAVLAILAVKLGASQADALDIDAWAVENAQENCALNQVSEQVRVRRGDLSSLPADARYDRILANINRNILIDAMPTLSKKLRPGGELWMSGFLVSEIPMIAEAAAKQGLRLLRQAQEADWAWVVVAL